MIVGGSGELHVFPTINSGQDGINRWSSIVSVRSRCAEPHFFRKDWTKKELDGLAALEVNGRSVILPVWYNVNRDDVATYSPMLTGRVAISSSLGLNAVVDEIVRAIS